MTQTDPLLGRAVMYGTAGLIGQFALWNVLQYDRRIYRRRRSGNHSEEN